MSRKGIIKYLQSKNPGFVSATATSTTSGSPAYLLDFYSNLSWKSGMDQNSSFTLDFHDRIIGMTGYALRTFHYDHYPIEWKVFGSIDSIDWVTIDHRKDALCDGYETVRSDDVIVCGERLVREFNISTVGAFRYIKMMQIGMNSAMLHNFATAFQYTFYLNSIELYGEVYLSQGYFSCVRHLVSLKSSIVSAILGVFLLSH